jgi:hypothetical protein
MFEFGIGILCIVVILDFYLGFKQRKKGQKLKKENLAYKEEINGLKLEIMELISKKERKEPDKAIQGIVDYLKTAQKKRETKVSEPLGVPVSYRQSEPLNDDFLTQSVIRNMNALNMNMTFHDDTCPSDHSDHACCEHGSDSSCSDSSSDCSCSSDRVD